MFALIEDKKAIHSLVWEEMAYTAVQLLANVLRRTTGQFFANRTTGIHPEKHDPSAVST